MTSATIRKTRWGIFAAVAVTMLAVGGVLRAGIIKLPAGPGAAGQKLVMKFDKNPAPVSMAHFQNGYSSIVDPALKAVVSISSTTVVRQQNNFPSLFNDPFFQQFFGPQMQQQPRTEREYRLGSGVIVNSNGYIITNNHVVAGAKTLEVTTGTDQTYKAKVIGRDKQTDIALLKINATNLPTLTLGDSSHLKVGDVVFAIGDPFAIGKTATMGIVSATHRALGGSIEHYENFIQTDAAINPGNSGGALIDMHGDLIGINTAIIAGRNGGGNEGIGFAIPINMAVNIVDQLASHGKVIRGYLGVHIEDVTPQMAQAFGLSHGGGALIADISPNGPAAKAGLKRGDIIEKLNGHRVEDFEELSVEISEMAPGAVAHLQIVRNGQTMQKDVTLGSFPTSSSGSSSSSGSEGSVLKGVQVQALTSTIAQQLNLPPGVSGVVVSQVDPNSAAAYANVERGDVIEEVDRKPVHNMSDYNAAVSAAGNKPVLLLIYRQGVTMYTVVQPQ